MSRSFVLLALVALLIPSNGMQVPNDPFEPISNPEDGHLEAQLEEMSKNLTSLWSYIGDLRSAITRHLKFLREHQVALESAVHNLEHHGHGDTHASHSDSHHHSGEDQQSQSTNDDHHHGDSHSHSGDSHSHSGDSHSHSGDSHSHSGDSRSHSGDSHSHSGDSHSHSGDSHSHSGDSHSHSGEQHSHSEDSHHHSGEQQSHDDHSLDEGSHHHSGEHHSHSSDSHSHTSESHSDHGHQHKDSHENEDIAQTQQKADDPQVEPMVVSSTQRPTSVPGGEGLNLFEENSVHSHDHHHHHSHSYSSRNTTVIPPKYSEALLYDFAICDVKPNRNIPEDKQQNVVGQITLWQKKTGGPINLHLKLQGFAMGDHHAHHGAHQAVQQQEEDHSTPRAGHRHGFHVHTNGDLSEGCQSTGPHYNPKGVNHGGPKALVRHVGDLGNIECDDHGQTNILFSDHIISLNGRYSVIGKSMVIHSGADDYGKGNNEESLKTGNAGVRIACCIIEKIDKLPVRSYKSIKNASQYLKQ